MQTRRWRDGGGDTCDPLFRYKDPRTDFRNDAYELVGEPGGIDSYELTEPTISPLHADLHNLPPSLIHVGDAEVMLSEAVDFARKAQAAGSPVEAKVWPRMWHCFNRFSEGCGTGVPLQQGIDALKQQGAFLRNLADGVTVCPAPDKPQSSAKAAGHCDLQNALKCHLEKDLVKGWEAHLRTVNGERRRPLQKAAKDARSASDLWHAGSSRLVTQHDYLTRIKVLLRELEHANESDFDGLLKEALVCLEGNGSIECDLPALTLEERAAFDRIWNHRFGGVGRYKGFARDRDLRRASQLRQVVLQTLSNYQSANDVESRVSARSAYICAVDELRGEIESAGEVDFDGLMRQAVRVVENGLIGKPAAGSTDVQAEPVASRTDASSTKAKRRWRPKGPVDNAELPNADELIGA